VRDTLTRHRRGTPDHGLSATGPHGPRRGHRTSYRRRRQGEPCQPHGARCGRGHSM